jgi:hypothetical protein
MLNLVLSGVAAWALAGVGAVAGSIVGNAAGKTGLFIGAAVGGVVGVVAAVTILIKLRWLAAADRRGALAGGAVGFAVAVPVAATNLHTPVIPVLVCGLAGAGLVLGVVAARRGRRANEG